RRDSTQRSSTASDCAGAGDHCSRFAYSEKKRYVLASVSNVRRADSPSAVGSKRFGTQGWLTVMKYQRMASAPYVARATSGSTVLPRDFDILRPSASRIWSLT